VNNQRYYWISR